MDVRFCIFGWLYLHDEINTWNIKPPGCYVSCNKDIEFFLLKPLKSDLALVLRNITVHNFNVFLDFV